MAGTNPRNDPFYAGDLNDLDAYSSIDEKGWAGGTRIGNAGALTIDDTGIIAAIESQTSSFISELDDQTIQLLDELEGFTPIE